MSLLDENDGLPVRSFPLRHQPHLAEASHLDELQDAADLAAKVAWADSHPRAMEEMGRAARAEFEAKYTAARNYGQLMAIFDLAVRAAATRNAAGGRNSAPRHAELAVESLSCCEPSHVDE